ncbi:MAG: SUMF1/EgtB/PvdO family nonheme iron enzyme [Pirellulales bacterium]|nr:SUMF1/EgtB/PvdO family nonheme iron enzyme [Pirellulales bacterium]
MSAEQPRDDDSVGPVFSESAPQNTNARTTSWTGGRSDGSTVQDAGPGRLCGKKIGRYTLQRVLGKGGFGTVYLGHDADLDRPVAVKFLDTKRLPLPHAFESLQNEARTLARLRHPGIVSVYDVGRDDDGTCYMVMEYIEGRSLQDWISRERLSLRQAAAGVAAIAEAVHHAHTQGLVHCDLKPGNVLIDHKGRFYVADFGLAVHEDTQRLLKGEVGGTRVYMAPEQVRGETHRLDGRTDIWGLGVLLYELLTGRRPFQGRNRDELLDEIKNREPKPLRQIDDSIPSELERICLKCLTKRMTGRYTTAMDLAGDLHQWIQTQSEASAGSVLPDDYSASDSVSSRERSWSTYSRRVPVKIVPRGLRPFGSQDKAFFPELLPGPRARDGLPESIHFWKRGVEDVDAGFGCGLIYGPSGSGKSSLVRAGLLPRLAGHVTAVYVEAMPGATEARLLKELRRRFPHLTDEQGLAESLALLRAGEQALPDRKVLIVLDQFEQWLHGQRAEADTRLVEALRQCDGQRLQCLILVRDDFWLATSRFLQDLEVRLVEGRNVGLVDLFDPRHATRVLIDFGQALGCLPEDLSQLTDGREAFLERAVVELTREGKVVPVQLSLFAEMVKAKPWSPETLDEVGGVEGLGVAFLEESFGARTANPQHRAHQQAARAVLRTLLPDSSADIKGHVRSDGELFEASGYTDQPAFDDLLRILDTELRLITPTDPEGQQSTGAELPRPESGRRYYQLAHDYLVGPLREWLTRKQKETWRGRARLCLEQRTAQWTRSQQPRFLPSPPETLAICVGVPKRQRTIDGQRMMRAAVRRYGTIALLLVALAAALGGAAWEVNGRIQGRRLTQAILASRPADLEGLVHEELGPYRRWADPRLRSKAFDESTALPQRIRAGLAIAAAGNGPADSPDNRALIALLYDRLFDCSPDEFPLIRDGLAPHKADLLPGLWTKLHDPADTPQHRRTPFRAGVCLATYAPRADAWTESDAVFLAEYLVRVNPNEQPDWRKHLKPVAARLLRPLEVVFRDGQLGEVTRTAAATALADFAAEDPRLLAELAADAIAPQYDVVYAALVAKGSDREAIVQRLRAILAETPRAAASAAERIGLARRRAGAAVTLIRLGQREDALRVLDPSEDGDPEFSTQLIHRLKDRGVTEADLLACLDAARDTAARYALLLALGEFVETPGGNAAGLGTAAEPQRARLRRTVLDWFRSDPDSGVHSACGWLLRRLDAPEAAKTRETPMPFDPTRKRNWFVETIGDETMTFVVCRPGSFMMGAADWDPDREIDEPLHEETIERAFALCDREVTNRHYRTFCTDANKLFPANKEFAPEPEHPVVGVDWYHAVFFCRWLTEQAGMDEADQCYNDPADWQRGVGGVFTTIEYHAERSGYRLPTEAEWEYACRAGTPTPYSFGSDQSLSGRYAWTLENSGRQAHTPGQLGPNPLGLFDMHGNAIEWCQDIYRTDPRERAYSRMLRGGSFFFYTVESRSAFRRRGESDAALSSFGFRVARTMAAPGQTAGGSSP